MDIMAFQVNSSGRLLHGITNESPPVKERTIHIPKTFNSVHELETFLHDNYYDFETETIVPQSDPGYTYSHPPFVLLKEGGLVDQYVDYIDEDGNINSILANREDVYVDTVHFDLDKQDTFIISNVENHEDLIIETIPLNHFGLTFKNNEVRFVPNSDDTTVQIFLDHPHRLSKTIVISYVSYK